MCTYVWILILVCIHLLPIVVCVCVLNFVYSFSEHCSKPLPAQVTYDQVFKLLIIGDSGVGKSSLLMQFSDNLLSDTTTSTGVDFKNCTVDVEGAKVKLQIWDTAGQERFRTLTSMYYRGTHGVIFVYDVTDADTFKSIRKWLHEIDQNCDRVSRVLVGNKVDDRVKKVVPLEEAQQFADQIGIPLYETSAKEGKNVEEVFHAIARLILKHKLETEPHKAASAGDRIVVQSGGRRGSGGGRRRRCSNL